MVLRIFPSKGLSGQNGAALRLAGNCRGGKTLRFNLCVSLLSDLMCPLHLFLDVITAFSVLAMKIKSMVPGTF